jgi:hypothetical protein
MDVIFSIISVIDRINTVADWVQLLATALAISACIRFAFLIKYDGKSVWVMFILSLALSIEYSRLFLGMVMDIGDMGYGTIWSTGTKTIIVIAFAVLNWMFWGGSLTKKIVIKNEKDRARGEKTRHEDTDYIERQSQINK